ncbi:MAG: hypothetical protein ACHQQQ_06940 [Bacteroidota bacterium]
MTSISVKNSEIIKDLMLGIIDYAGLFPPAKLDMPEAFSNYLQYRKSEYAWALGRFIVPVSRLSQFEQAASDLIGEENINPIQLSTLTDDEPVKALTRISDFNNGFFSAGRNVIIDTIEIKAPSSDDILKWNDLLPRHLRAYYEIPLNSSIEESIEAISLSGECAKVRTGGVTPEVFPAVGDLLRFIETCSRMNVPFKATAGLHHPVRGEYNFTYEKNSAQGLMFGFLNLFLTALFLHDGMSVSEASYLLTEDSPSAFRFDDQGITWRGFSLDIEQIRSGRENFAISFGSCSFTEPINDLKSFNLL